MDPPPAKPPDPIPDDITGARVASAVVEVVTGRNAVLGATYEFGLTYPP
jgi:hypothetical protein